MNLCEVENRSESLKFSLDLLVQGPLEAHYLKTQYGDNARVQEEGRHSVISLGLSS